MCDYKICLEKLYVRIMGGKVQVCQKQKAASSMRPFPWTILFKVDILMSMVCS